MSEHAMAPGPNLSSADPAKQVMIEATNRVLAGENLSRAEAGAVMDIILSGGASDLQIAALLTALREKSETVDELVGFATSMRRHAAPIFPNGRASTEEILVDTCGTGGDASGTFNISTAAAFVVAGAGVRVAKHGNRSISSRCGSADVLEALGVAIDTSGEQAGEAILQVGIGFLFAPAVHTAMKHAMPARRQIGGRTLFNLLGPLTNPAGASAQLVGVFDAAWTERLAHALGELGVHRAFVVHGVGGLDEISLAGESYIAELRDRTVRSYSVAPEDFGLQRAPLEAVAGGDSSHNARIIRRVLEGEKGPQRDIVLANAAAALVVADQAADFRDGARRAAAAIDSGAARGKLNDLAAFTASKKKQAQ